MMIIVRIRSKVIRKMTFDDLLGVALSFCYSLLNVCCLKRGFLPSTNIAWYFPMYLLLREIFATLTPSKKCCPLFRVLSNLSFWSTQFSFYKNSRDLFKLLPTFYGITSVAVFVISL